MRFAQEKTCTLHTDTSSNNPYDSALALDLTLVFNRAINQGDEP